MLNVGLQKILDRDDLANERAGHHCVTLFDVEPLTRTLAKLGVRLELNPVFLDNFLSGSTASEPPSVNFNLGNESSRLLNSCACREFLDELNLDFSDGLSAVRVVDFVNNANILTEVEVLFREDDLGVARGLEHAQKASDFADKRSRNRLCLDFFARLQNVDESQRVDSGELYFTRVPV